MSHALSSATEISVRASSANVPRVILSSTSPHELTKVGAGVFEALSEQNLWGANATNANVVMTTVGKLIASHMGVTLYAQQAHTLDMLERLVVKTAIADQSVPLRFVLQKLYLITDQMIAEMGTPDTVTGGVNTRKIEVSVPLVGRVLSMMFESGITQQTSEQVADVINRELNYIGTSWALTKIHEILTYCANQLTITEATAVAVRKSTPAGRIKDLAAISDIVCGAINMNPATIYSLISTGLDLAISIDTPMVIVMPKCIHKALTSGALVSGGMHLGPINSSRDVIGFTLDNTGGNHVIQPTSYNMRYTDSAAAQQASDKMISNGTETGQCYYITMSNGKEIPVIVVDDAGMDRNKSLQDGMCSKNSVRAEYFTVGSMAPVMKDLHSNGIFELNSELDTNKIHMRSPDTTYVNCYGDASTKRVTLRELHAVANPQELFSANRAASLAANIGSIPLTSYTNEHILTMLNAKHWTEKMAVPQAQYEVDARFRVSQHDRVGDRVIMNRCCLFNMSPLNDCNAEAIQIGAELVQTVGKLQLDAIAAIRDGLYDIAHVADVRAARTAGAIQNHDYHPIYFADPECFLLMAADIAGNNQASDAQKNTHLMMMNFRRSVLSAFYQISGDANRSILHNLPMLFGPSAVALSQEDILFVKIMQYVILPLLASNVTARTVNVQDQTIQINDLIAQGLHGTLGRTVVITTGVYISGSIPVNEVDANHLVAFMAPPNVDISRESLFSRMWAHRISVLRSLPIEVGMLVSLHYMLKLTRSNFIEWFDRKYYSGWSYLCIRYVNFDAWGFSIMPQKNSIYHYGQGVVTVRSTHDKITTTLYRETGITAASIDKMGTFIDNVYMSNISGGDLVLPESETRAAADAIVIVDCFNSYVPNSQISTSNSGSFLFAHGRSDPDTDQAQPDPMLENNMYTSMPTLHVTMSAANVRIQRYGHNRGRETSNAALFMKTKRVSTIDEMFAGCRADPRTYYAEKISRPPVDGRIYNSNSGIVFCATYGIGRLSDSVLRYGSDYRSICDRLAPRVGGTGIFSGSSISEVGTAFSPVLNRTLVVPWRRHMQF